MRILPINLTVNNKTNTPKRTNHNRNQMYGDFVTFKRLNAENNSKSSNFSSLNLTNFQKTISKLGLTFGSRKSKNKKTLNLNLQYRHKQKSINQKSQSQPSQTAEDIKIAVMNKILLDENLCDNEYVRTKANTIINSTDTSERLQVANKILSDEKLYNNEGVMDNVRKIIINVDTPERLHVANKILSDEKLYNNEDVMSNLGDILRSAETPAQLKFADKILSDIKLYENNNIMNNLEDTISRIRTPKEVQVKIALINKVLSDEKLYSNERIMKELNSIISSVKTRAQFQVVNKILSHEELLYYNQFIDKISNMVYYVETPKIANMRIDLINTVLSDKNLYSDARIMREVSKIISSIITPAQFQVANKILFNKKLRNNCNIMQNPTNIINTINTSEQLQVVNKIISNEKLYNNEKFINNIHHFICYTGTPERLHIINKILQDEALYNSDCVMDSVSELLCQIKTPEQLQIANKILSDEKLYNNEDVMYNVDGIIHQTNTPEKLQIADKILSDEKLYGNYVISKNIEYVIEIMNAKTMDKDLPDFIFVMKEAFAKKNQLKSLDEDITDEIISEKFRNIDIMNLVKYLGIPTVIASFPLKFDGMEELSEDVTLLEESISEEAIEELLQKINPEGLTEYQNLMTEVAELKKSYPEVKANNPAALGWLQKEIATKTKKLQTLKNNSLKLPPQDILEKIRILAAIATHNTDDFYKFLDLIQKPTRENETKWRNEINKYIFNVFDFDFDQNVSDKLHLEKSRYIGEILVADSDFKEYFKEILQLIKENPNKTIKDIFDELPQNKITRKMFEELGLDYDKYGSVDENLSVHINIKTSIDAARKSAIKSLENEFNDIAFLALPETERAKITSALKDKLGVELKEVQEQIWDEDGFPTGTKKVQRLYKDNKPIEFEALQKIIKNIKETINANDFWTTEIEGDDVLNGYKNTMYTHFMKDRSAQIKNTHKIKEDKETGLTVQKTDMNNIRHALFLGNQIPCCTSVGNGCNQFSAPTYIKNKMVSAIEVVDGENFVGNTMCYIAKVNNEPALVLDNIEIKSQYQDNDTIRDAIIEYAKRMCAEIGNPKMPIYAGPYRHKLNMEIYPKDEYVLELVGNTGEDEIYLDFITSEETVDGEETYDVNLYKIR